MNESIFCTDVKISSKFTRHLFIFSLRIFSREIISKKILECQKKIVGLAPYTHWAEKYEIFCIYLFVGEGQWPRGWTGTLQTKHQVRFQSRQAGSICMIISYGLYSQLFKNHILHCIVYFAWLGTNNYFFRCKNTQSTRLSSQGQHITSGNSQYRLSSLTNSEFILELCDCAFHSGTDHVEALEIL